MAFRYWHLMVPVVLSVLVLWSVRKLSRRTLFSLAVTLLALSAFLLYTLVLGEPYLEPDPDSRREDLVLIGIPAFLGLGFGGLAALVPRFMPSSRTQR